MRWRTEAGRGQLKCIDIKKLFLLHLGWKRPGEGVKMLTKKASIIHPPSLENTLTPIFTERYRIPILGGSLEHDVHMWREKDKSIF